MEVAIKPVLLRGLSLNTRLLIAVVLSAALILDDHRFRHLDQVRTVLSVLTYPLIYGASATWLVDLLSFRTNILELEQSNKKLHQENLLLQARLQQLDALEAENIRLRDLLGSSFKIGDRVLIAELIIVDPDPYRQRVMINKGSDSGVFVGQPVLDAHAVVGQVVRITPQTSTVLLITDAAHALPVQVNRNGLRTIAQGTGFINKLRLLYLANNVDIRVGDLLTTSGLGGHFLPGYPVATVSEVHNEPGKAFATIVATPSAQLQRIHEVLLVWTINPERTPEAPLLEGTEFSE